MSLDDRNLEILCSLCHRRKLVEVKRLILMETIFEFLSEVWLAEILELVGHSVIILFASHSQPKPSFMQ